jgi:hypothetical protein
MRVLAAHGGTCEDGHAALALALDIAERSVQRAAAALRTRGWLAITRRGRGKTATLALTRVGHEVLGAFGATADRPIGRLGTDALTSPDTPIGRYAGQLVPVGFVGDAHALSVARMVLRIGASAKSSADLARAYLEHASEAELARLLGLIDEHSLLPTESSATGDPTLDDGLRTHFWVKARADEVRHRNDRAIGRLRRTLDE